MIHFLYLNPVPSGVRVEEEDYGFVPVTCFNSVRCRIYKIHKGVAQEERLELLRY